VNSKDVVQCKCADNGVREAGAGEDELPVEISLIGTLASKQPALASGDSDTWV